jgi:endonuclease YncB( thermonuclease family)
MLKTKIYGRTLAVVYVANINLNQELLKRGYAEVMYIPPSEFNPYSWT